MVFRSLASERFWQLYSALPSEVQRLADKQYELFCEDPYHPSLHLKKIGEMWSVRIGRSNRAIGYREGDIFHWGWIGSHEEYNKFLRHFEVSRQQRSLVNSRYAGELRKIPADKTADKTVADQFV
jgi:hypothetical protein